MLIDIQYQRVFALLQCVLADKALDSELFRNMESGEWLAVMECAQRQGVMAVCFEAFEKTDIRPDIDNLMEWLGQTEHVRTHFLEKQCIIKSFTDLLKKKNIPILLMKGISIANLYPSPQLREFGDIDIYPFELEKKLYETLSKINVSIEYGTKHDSFNYKGVLFESHTSFFNLNSKSGRILNRYLKDIPLESYAKSDDGYLIPTANFNAVFLLKHMAKHFSYIGANFRQFVDWGVFLEKDGENVDWADVYLQYTSTGMMKIFNYFTKVSQIVTGYDLSKYIKSEPDPRIVQRIIESVQQDNEYSESKCNLVVRYFQKAHRLYERLWRFRILLPDSYIKERIFPSIVEHLGLSIGANSNK